MNLYRSTVLVCGGTGCTSSGSHNILERFETLIRENGLENEVMVVRTGCFGLCEAGPVVLVYPEGSFYSHVKVEDVDEIVSEHLIKGRIVTRLLQKGSIDESGAVKALEAIRELDPQAKANVRRMLRSLFSSGAGGAVRTVLSHLAGPAKHGDGER